MFMVIGNHLMLIAYKEIQFIIFSKCFVSVSTRVNPVLGALDLGYRNTAPMGGEAITGPHAPVA